jgi:hypothetical protein
MVEQGEVILLEDSRLKDQLAQRYYKQGASGKIVLESKREAKAAGRPSPDRADAAVMACSYWEIEKPAEAEKDPRRMSVDELIARFDNDAFEEGVQPGELGALTLEELVAD